MTPDPSHPALHSGIGLLAEKWRNTGSSMRDGAALTSWCVMLTTAGIAARRPAEEVIAAVSGLLLRGSLIVTTSPRVFHASRSGRKVETTNSTATQMVAVWQNVSQSLRMGFNEC